MSLSAWFSVYYMHISICVQGRVYMASISVSMGGLGLCTLWLISSERDLHGSAHYENYYGFPLLIGISDKDIKKDSQKLPKCKTFV